MAHPEKYARPGHYLDTDDHERLIEENREQYLQDRRERLLNELREVEDKLHRI